MPSPVQGENEQEALRIALTHGHTWISGSHARTVLMPIPTQNQVAPHQYHFCGEKTNVTYTKHPPQTPTRTCTHKCLHVHCIHTYIHTQIGLVDYESTGR